jgi:hypothetical protein
MVISVANVGTLDARAPGRGQPAYLSVDHRNEIRQLRHQLRKLIHGVEGHFQRSDHGSLSHSTSQSLFTQETLEVAHAVWGLDRPDNFRVSEIVVVEQFWLARDINLDTGQHLLHMVQKLIGEIFAASPFSKAKRDLLLNCLLRTGGQDGFSLSL